MKTFNISFRSIVVALALAVAAFGFSTIPSLAQSATRHVVTHVGVPYHAVQSKHSATVVHPSNKSHAGYCKTGQTYRPSVGATVSNPTHPFATLAGTRSLSKSTVKSPTKNSAPVAVVKAPTPSTNKLTHPATIVNRLPRRHGPANQGWR